MFRSKFVRALTFLILMAGILYLCASLYLPSSRKMIFGIDKRNGYVRMVRSHVTFLPPHRYYRLPFEKREGSAQLDGLIRIETLDQVPVTITYRLRFGLSGQRLADVRKLVNDGWSAWIRARVSEAVQTVTRQVPIEELLTPTSQFNLQRREILRRVVAQHLGRSGLNVTAFEIARLEADRDALLKAKRTELRRSARGVAGRVVIFALDGADWDLLSELSNDERIPNLKALSRSGTTASMQTIQPTVSPMLWTTVATGLAPDRHGVIDFVEPVRNTPADAYTRRGPAIWDIAESFGRHSAVVNWWTDWPPSSPGVTVFDAPVESQIGAAYPDAVAKRAQQLAVPVDTIGFQQVRRFLNISEAEYDRAVSSGNAADPINIFRNVLAKTWTDHRVALNVFQQQQPLVTMVHFDGTDVVNHLFGPYHPPQRDDVNDDNYRKYWPGVANYYSEVDRLIGEWMSVLPADTTVMILSAHGFKWGKTRPRAIPNGRAALSDHRNPGMFIAYGNHVAPSRLGHQISIYDIAPTVLSILGLPKSAEMPGTTATWMFKDLTPVESVRVVSYAEFMNDRPLPLDAGHNMLTYRAELQAIGHLADPQRNLTPIFEDEDVPTQTASAKPLSPEQWGRYAYFNNLGIELQKQKKYKEATEALDKAIELNPDRPTPFLNYAILLFDHGNYADAEALLERAVQHGLPNADQYYVDLAALYRAKNAPSRGIALLYKARNIYPQSYLIAANLGANLIANQRYTEGVPELERALGMQPSSTPVLNNLGVFYAKKNDYARALDYWNRSLAINPRQPQIRQASEAARTRL
ncbi:MAG: alkaline phosphatase family protein [Acidobacteria bacterium]|nr:alkaline phosphatase family protein [Acidobacteriota bacterium]